MLVSRPFKRGIVEEVNKRFDEEMQDLSEQRATFKRFIAPVLSVLSRLPSWEDVSTVTSYKNLVSIYLDPLRKESTLPREIAMALEAHGTKGTHGDSLYVDYRLPSDMLLTVYGYLPASCHIVEEEVYVPGEVRKVKKVICTEEERKA